MKMLHTHKLKPLEFHHSGQELLAEAVWLVLAALALLMSFALLTVWQA